MSRLAAAASLLLCLSATAQAQDRTQAVDSADVLVLDHDFTVTDEIVRIFLVDRQVYRAELSSEDVTLVLLSRFSGRPIPRVYPIGDSRTASGSSIVEIYPDQDGEYELRPITIQGSRISTRLRIYRDVAQSRRRLATANRPGWELGIELAGGWHSGFAQSGAAPLPGSDPADGTDVEGCFRPALRGPTCVSWVSVTSRSRAGATYSGSTLSLELESWAARPTNPTGSWAHCFGSAWESSQPPM